MSTRAGPVGAAHQSSVDEDTQLGLLARHPFRALHNELYRNFWKMPW